MKKNYIAPDTKVVKVALQNMVAVSMPVYNGEGEGGADLAKEDLFDGSILEDFDLGADDWSSGADAWE